MNINQELLETMEKCGHFLYHRRGGKRGQGKILQILLKEEEITQKELQERFHIQPGSMSEIVRKLENAGLIQRTKDESDRRKSILKITEEGKQVVLEKKMHNLEQEKKLFDVLEKSEQRDLLRLLSKLFQSWESTYEKSLFEQKKGRQQKKTAEYNVKARVGNKMDLTN